MRQLHSQHPIDTKPGEVGVTVRRGRKWADLRAGQRIELTAGVDDADRRHVGHAEVLETHLCRFEDIPARLIEYEHEESSRLYSGLLASMRRAYGPNFWAREEVVVLVYRRID